jgi:cytochrome P450
VCAPPVACVRTLRQDGRMGKILRPPGPSATGVFKLLGVTPFRARDPLTTITDWARKYGDIFHYRLLHFHVYFVNSPELVEQVLVTQNRKFQKGRALQANRELLGNGLLISEGETWQRQRRLMQPAFGRERIVGYGRTMVASTEKMLGGWRDGETRDIHKEMMALTLDIAARTLISVEIASVSDRIAKALEAILIVAARPARILSLVRKFPSRTERNYVSAVRDLDEIVYGIIRERRAARSAGATQSTPDLLGMLLAAQDEDGSGMTDKQIRDETLTLLLAGHETTAIALSWAWYLLSENPATERKLHDELESVLGGRVPAVEDLPRLPYTERVVKEAMRLYPPAYIILRLSVEDCEMGGYKIPRGSSVGTSSWVVHRDARFFPDPEKFLPERWTEEFQRSLPRYAYFPFGGGPRVCIGAQFAMMEAMLALAGIAQRYSLKLVPGHPVETSPSITLRPRFGLRMTLHRR